MFVLSDEVLRHQLSLQLSNETVLYNVVVSDVKVASAVTAVCSIAVVSCVTVASNIKCPV